MADETANQGIPQPQGEVDLIDTDYEIGQDNIETKIGPFGIDIHNPVFVISGLAVILFVALALILPDQLSDFFGWLRPSLTSSFSWFFLGAANLFVVFCLALIVLPVGNVRLGGPEARPDFGYPGWFAMLFAAGMGIGLMFYGVSEPMSHYSTSAGGTSWSVSYAGAAPQQGEDETDAAFAERVEQETGLSLDAFTTATAISAGTADEARSVLSDTVSDEALGAFQIARTDWAPGGAAPLPPEFAALSSEAEALDAQIAEARAAGAEPAAELLQERAAVSDQLLEISTEARNLGMAATIFHWGLHPWAIYAVVALALALFSYNKGLPLSIRSAFYPLFGDAVWGWLGHVIDTVAVFATLFGLATSLGIGAEQAAAGLNLLFGSGEATEGTRQVFGFSYDNPVEGGDDGEVSGIGFKVALICAITAVALVSVVRGLDGGVKILSEINMGLAGLLLLFVLAVGPSIELLTGFFSGLWAYLQNLWPLSNPVGREDTNFMEGWTAFYWAWWISWSPFVGMFIARVSRGRTVREFMICVLLIPSFVCVLWMTVFGGTAINQVIADGYTGAQNAGLELQLFQMLAELPLAQITSFIGIVLVIVFFVTSSDSGSLVIDTITAGGKVDAPVPQRVFWCTFEGLVAVALLIGGGLGALQAMVISTGLPFTIVLLLMCFAIYKGLLSERRAT